MVKTAYLDWFNTSGESVKIFYSLVFTILGNECDWACAYAIGNFHLQQCAFSQTS